MASLAPCRLYARSCLLETLPYKTVKLKRLSNSRRLSTSLAANAENPSSSTDSPPNLSETSHSHQHVSSPQLPYQTNFASAASPTSPSATPAPTGDVRREPASPSVLPPRYRPDSPDYKSPPRYDDSIPRLSNSASETILRQLPNSSNPDPVIPANGSLFPRVSLAPNSFSKIPARMWGKRPGDAQKTYNPFAAIKLDKESKEGDSAPPPSLYENPNWDAIQEIRNREKFTRPPVPKQTAVHCVISPIPHHWLPSDVLHLIPWDHSSAQQSHPVEVYVDNFLPEEKVVLRFSHPKHLQKFLNHLPKIQVAGRQIEAQLFYDDADKTKFKPFSVLRRKETPSTILRPRWGWMGYPVPRARKSDIVKTTTLVVVSGVPHSEKIASVEYWARFMLEDQKFEWAYGWTDEKYGQRAPSKHNVVCVEPRDNQFNWARRWSFILKDEENAWRFARFVDKTYYRTERFEDKFEISARVMN